jgi:hypothetical protein
MYIIKRTFLKKSQQETILKFYNILKIKALLCGRE